MAMTFEDIIDRPSLPRSFESSAEERLRLLARAAELLENGTDYEKTIDFIAHLLVSSLAKWCTIDLFNSQGRVERVSVAHRDPAKSDIADLICRRYPASPQAQRGVYKVIETREPILLPVLTREDWARRADDPTHLEVIMELGSTTYMCLPLIAQGRVVGAIMMLSDDRVYDDRDFKTGQELARLIAMAVDNVSMFRRMQATMAELEKTNHQLVQSSKLAVLGVISAGIAHEINNPLTVIRYYLAHIEALFAKGLPPTRWEFSSFAEKMNRSIDRIVKIVNNVKEFSRESERRYEPLDLRNVLDVSLGLLDESFVLNRIRVERRWPDTEICVIGDPKCLEQVVVNVLSNAKDAIVSRHLVGGVVIVQVVMTNEWVSLVITDDGTGIPDDQRVRIFDPFFTTKEAGRGSGLGLSISHGIVADHGGHIDVASREGRGTTVTIRLPRAVATSELSATGSL